MQWNGQNLRMGEVEKCAVMDDRAWQSIGATPNFSVGFFVDKWKEITGVQNNRPCFVLFCFERAPAG